MMDFNFNKEYKQMHRTMTKFNNWQIDKKNLISKLSKENKIELALENKYQDNEATKEKIKQIYQYINKFTEN